MHGFSARRLDAIAGATALVTAEAVGSRGIGQDRVDLPLRTVRALHPHLVLDGVATRGPGLYRRLHALSRAVNSGGGYLVGRGDLDPEMVDRTGLAGALDQDQLQRRIYDGEVGVPGTDLGRLGMEERRVEGDGFVEI